MVKCRFAKHEFEKRCVGKQRFCKHMCMGKSIWENDFEKRCCKDFEDCSGKSDLEKRFRKTILGKKNLKNSCGKKPFGTAFLKDDCFSYFQSLLAFKYVDRSFHIGSCSPNVIVPTSGRWPCPMPMHMACSLHHGRVALCLLVFHSSVLS